MTNIIKRIYHNRNTSTGSLIIRLLLGVLFISSGWMKITHITDIVQFFTADGFTAFQAHLVAYTELIAGALLILGLFQKPACVALATIMAVVVWGTTSQPNSLFFGHDYEFVILVTLIGLYLQELTLWELTLLEQI